MKNQDMPANILRGVNGQLFTEDDFKGGDLDEVLIGETKREKAFWQVFSAMTASGIYDGFSHKSIANDAIKAVNAGFKALESDNE